MEYILFSLALIITLVVGIVIGIYAPYFILKNYKQETKVEKQETENITKDIMNEWLNGRGE